MKKKKALLFGLVLFLMLSFAPRFLDIVEDFSSRVSGYYHEKIGGVLFLHTDKSIYIPNESIWFKAYILDSDSLQHEVLYLRLLNEQKQIVLQKEFQVYDIRSHGDMLLPIILAPGRYSLIAYTDKMISFNPENIFVQQIQVIKDQLSDLKAEASIADHADFSAGKKPKIKIKVSAGYRPIAKVRGKYKIYTLDKKTVIEGKFVTSPTGVAMLNFTYPVIGANEDLFLQCIVMDKDQSKELNLRLPKSSSSTVSAQCYPEGGHLINGISNRVLIAVTDAGGRPMVAKVVLKSQARQIVTTTTNIDGLTLIAFTPDVREKYSLAINSPEYSGTIPFPVKTDTAGYVIHLTGSPDHPAVMVKNQNMEGNIILLGRTLSELKLNKPLFLKSGDSVLVPLPRNDSVNHVIDLGLFDTGNKLLAERLVYLPVPEKYHITFHFDKAGYTSREKVRADIMVTDVNGNPISANLSVAVVAKQTLDSSAEKRITQTDLYALQHYRTNSKEINDLNDELIKEDIRSGSWTDVMNYQPKGQIVIYSNAAGVFGYVVNKKKKKIALKTLYLYGKSGITAVQVNDNGSFSIPGKDLVTQRGETKYLIVNSDFNDRYDLQIKNYSAAFDSQLVISSVPESLPFYDPAKHSAQLSSVMSAKILSEVIVKSKKGAQDWHDLTVTEYRSITCSDYICFYNILNCKNHPGGTLPVEGQIYVLDGRTIRYHGCRSSDSKKNAYTIKNIDSPQSFYLPDYASEPVSAPELQSTIFWEPNLNTQPKGKSTIEFYTSDISGAFTIVVQGLTVKGMTPIFGKSEFMVIQKKESSDK